MDTAWDFVPPPECPVFEPTWEEFQDPMAYIQKIKPIAEKTGICKVKPPSGWQPPFAVDVDTFKFTPRIQRLNELEATTRIKLNFLDQLAKFWELQGNSLRIPNVERRSLDLYTLSKIVNQEGGFEIVCKERKWSKIAARLNYPHGKGVGSMLKTHYERVLYPYDVFQTGVTLDSKKVEGELAMALQELREKDDSNAPANSRYKRLPKKDPIVKTPANITSSGDAASGEVLNGGEAAMVINDDAAAASGEVKVAVKESAYDSTVYKSHNIAEQEAEGRYSRRMGPKRAAKDAELKKLQFLGAGPKAVLPLEEEEPETEIDAKTGKKKKMKTRDHKDISYADTYHCKTCTRGDGEEAMLLCDGCDDAFHTYCLVPPLPDIPKGDWRCPKCLAKECTKARETYGFDQSKLQYSLQTFGEKADQFKLDYFNMPVHMVPCSTVEKEYWRLTQCVDEDVSVEYGADVHAKDFGSGFPTEDTRDVFPDDEDYINSPWNLNNLGKQSLLLHVPGDISGMKVPWCYVGMVFSTFAWHTEDHWARSINYNHWGEPKTWYGVPGHKAELLEAVMQKNAPELFAKSKDLMHHVTTIMNPNILMAHGVPVVRTDQHAGEFVVIMDRAYHGGFNQGYNFCEAVNFCMADWLPLGRECVEHYKRIKRQCVFSHEELICKMAADPDRLDVEVAAQTYSDMLTMVEIEKNLRKTLLDRGTIDAEREAFELVPDDERECKTCKTTCFLSAVTCPCTPDTLTCIEHAADLCECPASKHCLRYRYTLDELPTMLHKLKTRAEAYDNWAFKVKMALEADDEQKLDLLDLKELITEAEDKRFPDSYLLQTLIEAVGDAEKCASVANQLVSKKVRTRNRQNSDTKTVAKLTVEELECFNDQVSSLPCKIKEAALIQDLLSGVKDFQAEAQHALNEETPNSSELEKLMEASTSLDVDLPEIPKLKQVLLQARWLDSVRDSLQETPAISLDAMRKLIEGGVSLAPHPACERAMAELQELLNVSERWEEKARICLQARPRHVMTTLEAIVNEAAGIPTCLPNIVSLRDAIERAQAWMASVEAAQAGEHYPYLDVLETLVNKGRPIPVRLDNLPQLESQVNAAKSWRERTARTFLKKNSTFTLVEVLSPRSDVGLYGSARARKRKQRLEGGEKDHSPSGERNGEGHQEPAAMVAAYKQSELREIGAMQELRTKNIDKHDNHSTESKYCVCRKPPTGFMLMCELCKDWFHSNCVPLPKSAQLKNKSSPAAVVQAARNLKFLCPLCLRSRRPRLETILSLLVSLQKLPVRLAEGEALQCLTERAMAWQDRARQALATDELAAALAKLSVLSQRMVEQAAREKTEKIINAELLKAASNPELQGHLHSVTQSAFGGATPTQGSSPDQEHLPSLPALPVPVPAPLSPSSSDSTSETDALPSATGVSEHAYSTASKSHNNATDGSSPRRQHSRKSPLVPRCLEAPVLELSSLARSQLEGLMMEGELLEVSLDETQHIWRILQACQPPNPAEPRQLDFQDPLLELLGEQHKLPGLEEKKKKNRKRKDVETPFMDVSKETTVLGRPKKKKLKPKDLKEAKGKKADKDAKKKKKKLKKIKDGIKEKKMKKGKKADEDEDLCSARKCLKPMGLDIPWVQCDGCEEWYHMLCVGLSPNQISEDQDYVCYRCQISSGEAATFTASHHLPPYIHNKPSTVRAKLPIPNQENYMSGMVIGENGVPEPIISQHALNMADTESSCDSSAVDVSDDAGHMMDMGDEDGTITPQSLDVVT